MGSRRRRISILLAGVACAFAALAPAASAAPDQPWITTGKAEAQVDLNPGQTRVVDLACPNANDLALDGMWRVDSVDQGTGTLNDVHVLEARSINARTYRFRLRNGAHGRAQTKVFVTCLNRAVGGHTVAAPSLTTVNPGAPVGGVRTANHTCPAGTVTVAPGFQIAAGNASIQSSYPQVFPTSWRFRFSVSGATTITTTVRCLPVQTSAAGGHRHNLLWSITSGPAGATDADETVLSCTRGRAMVGGWRSFDNLFFHGMDPRPVDRAFKHTGHGGGQVAVLCLADRASFPV